MRFQTAPTQAVLSANSGFRVIKNVGMDELSPCREIIFAVAEEHRLKIIEQLVEVNIHTSL